MPLSTHNPDLPIVLADFQGNPLDEKGRYRNLGRKSERTYQELLRWQFSGNPQRDQKKTDTWKPELAQDTDWMHSAQDMVVWLGHATFFIRLDGVHFLTDPVYGNVGPVKRRSPFPFAVEALPRIDYVLMSHNHRDHADKSSFIRTLQLHPQAQVLTSLGMSRLLKVWVPKVKITEAGWFQRYLNTSSIELTYLPAMHWARRGPFDLNDMLWGSFHLKGKNHSVFFGADSGLDYHFGLIGQHFPNADVAILGIGAYSPEWFMHTSHTSPVQAVRAFEALKAKRMVPMHYGTFDLSDEPFGEPFRKISELAALRNDIHVLRIGEALPL